MTLQKMIIIFIVTLFCRNVFSAEANFHVITTKELPNQLGTFRTIEFNRPDHQTVTLYAVTFNSPYRANFHIQANFIAFLHTFRVAAILLLFAMIVILCLKVPRGQKLQPVEVH